MNPYLDVYNEAYTSSVFLLKPALPSSYDYWQNNAKRSWPNKALINRGYANKLNFNILNYKGFNAGVSFTPHLNLHNMFSYASDRAHYNNEPSYNSLQITNKNIATAGLSYSHNFNQDWNTKLSLVVEIGSNDEENRKKIKAYERSGIIAYKDFKVSAAKGDCFKTNMVKNTKGLASYSKNNTDYWSVAVAYKIKQY